MTEATRAAMNRARILTGLAFAAHEEEYRRRIEALQQRRSLQAMGEEGESKREGERGETR